MTRFRPRLARVAFAILAGFGLLSAYAKEPVTSDTKTYCVGRFLVDMPKEAEINGQTNKYMFGRIESEVSKIDAKDFEARMDKREAALKAIDPDEARSLKEAHGIGPSGRILVTFENMFGAKDYGFEAYKLDHDRLFSLKYKNSLVGEDVFRSKVLNPVQRDLLPHLRVRQPDEIPSEPGFCFENGFVADDASHTQDEDAAIDFRFARWPDLAITVITSTVSKAGEESLLQRVDSHPAPAALAGKIKTLRRGVHQANGRQGEEILELMPADGSFEQQHSFMWEAAGTKDHVLSPDLVVQFASGTPLNGQARRSALSDDDAIKLFDSIVNSIRLRPTSPAKVGSAEAVPQVH
ncbi:T6SS immunity protein Tli4 family protein [Paraherbaspirillum soli]|uniref:T6SS immunity protein Tli4 family protein n=1 Tax=Paraherbaspirillum soli TaxID=631222 RepID=A0ABW0M7P9_9BURK